MNRNIIEGNVEQVKGWIKEQWSKLTDDDLRAFDGKEDQLRGKLQERYGYGQEELNRQLDRFTEKHRSSSSQSKGSCCAH